MPVAKYVPGLSLAVRIVENLRDISEAMSGLEMREGRFNRAAEHTTEANVAGYIAKILAARLNDELLQASNDVTVIDPAIELDPTEPGQD